MRMHRRLRYDGWVVMKRISTQIRLAVAEWLLARSFHICPDRTPEKTDFAMALNYVFSKGLEREYGHTYNAHKFRSVRGKYRYEGK